MSDRHHSGKPFEAVGLDSPKNLSRISSGPMLWTDTIEESGGAASSTTCPPWLDTGATPRAIWTHRCPQKKPCLVPCLRASLRRHRKQTQGEVDDDNCCQMTNSWVTTADCAGTPPRNRSPSSKIWLLSALNAESTWREPLQTFSVRALATFHVYLGESKLIHRHLRVNRSGQVLQEGEACHEVSVSGGAELHSQR